MYPLKIIGFLENINEGIMLPVDLLNVGGFDFDIDKLFLFFKDFYINDNDEVIIDELEVPTTLNTIQDPIARKEFIKNSVFNNSYDKATLNNAFIDVL
jgi:hypothetical protein